MRAEGRVRRAEASELDYVLGLLKGTNLPVDRVKENFGQFFVWRAGWKTPVKGCIGLELYGEDAVLRSFAVHPEFRSLGIGSELLKASLKHACESGATRVYILTTTAAGYFSRKGFQRIDTETVAPAVAQSIEFQSVCPKSAICMSLSLAC